MKHHIIPSLLWSLLLAVCLGVLVTSCASPLDVDAPRTETPLTPAIKVTPTSYEVTFTSAAGAYVMKGLPTIKIDTTLTPMRFWLDITMEKDPASSATPQMQGFRLRRDSASCNGYNDAMVNGEVQFVVDLGTGTDQIFGSDATAFKANMIIAEAERVPGQPRKVTMTLYFNITPDSINPTLKPETHFATIEVVI